jgi:hypothetical protein
MSQSAVPRSVRAFVAGLAVAASALGAACGNPVAPRDAAAAPRTSVSTTGKAESSTVRSDTAAAAPGNGGAYSGGGVLPWY